MTRTPTDLLAVRLARLPPGFQGGALTWSCSCCGAACSRSGQQAPLALCLECIVELMTKGAIYRSRP